MNISKLKRYLPIFDWLPLYSQQWLRLDLLAGLTTAAVVIPKSMAYAAIAGLPIEVGLYTILVPMFVYAIFGSSRLLSVSTTSAIAILTAGQLVVSASGSGDPATRIAIASTLAFLVGCCLLLASLFRWGFLANFISDPVLAGFKAGIGVVIIVDQLPKLLGLHLDKAGILKSLFLTVQILPQAHLPTLLLGVSTLVIMLILEHRFPKFPAPLLAVAGGIAASGVLGLAQSGVEIVGNIPTGIPTPTVPQWSLMGDLWPAAAGIALMSFTETVAAGRAFMGSSDPRPQANQELFALGLANLVGSGFQIIPAGGGTSQTAVSYNAGGKTQITGLVTVAVVLATLFILAPLISLLPKTTLAAVVIATTIGLLNPLEFKAIWRIRSTEFWWSVVALAGVIFLGTLKGILVAVAVSLLTLLYASNHPPLYELGRKPGTDVFRPLSPEHPDDEIFPQLLMIRTEGRMTFASVPRLRDRLNDLVDSAHPQVVVFDLSGVPDIEYTAIQRLSEFDQKLQTAGINLWLAALNPQVLKVIRRSPLGAKLGQERLFFNLEQAVNHFQSKIENTSN